MKYFFTFVFFAFNLTLFAQTTDSTKTKTPSLLESAKSKKSDSTSTASPMARMKAVALADSTKLKKSDSTSTVLKTIAVPAPNQVPVPVKPLASTSLVGLKVYDEKDEVYSLDSLSQGKPTVVVFFSLKCLVSGLYNERFNEIYNDYVQKVTFVFINSNDEESWSDIQKYFKDNSLIFDAVKDKGHVTATALNVIKIPSCFIFNVDGTLAYRGKIDNNPRVQGTIYGSQLQTNLEAVLNNESITTKETATVGCDLVKQ